MYYEYSDRVLKTIRKRLIDMFVTAKSKLPIDEINEPEIITYAGDMYDEIDRICKMYFKKVSSAEYERITGHKGLADDFIEYMLTMASPITGYKFEPELERKKFRFMEGVAAGKEETFKTSMNYVSRMIGQEMIEVVDAAVLQAYRDMGVKKVMWHTFKDEKVCHECGPLDGKIFNIDDIPVKPHINCRCYITPVTGEKK